jgi:hypothetical protein
MKANIILTIVLVIQLIAFLSMGTSEVILGHKHTVGLEFAASTMLATTTNGTGLKKWLDQQGVDPKNIASVFAIDANEVETALKQSQAVVSDQLLSRLEAAAITRKITQFTVTEGIFDAEDASSTAISPKNKSKKKSKKESTSSSKKAKEVSLKRSDMNWVLTSSSNYPADQSRVDTFLKKWSSLPLKLPIATRPAHHRKLRVSDQFYDRKFTLTYEGKKYTWYIGNGKRGSIHIRVATQAQVYQIKGLSTWGDLSVDQTRYLKSSYLKVAHPVAITVEGPKRRKINLKKSADLWEVEGLDSAKVEMGNVKSFVNSAQEVMLTKVIRKAKVGEFKANPNSTKVTVKGELKAEIQDNVATKETTKSKTLTAKNFEKKTFYLLAMEDDIFHVQAEDNPFIIAVMSHKVKVLRDQKIEDFMNEDSKAFQNKAVNPSTYINSSAPVVPAPVAPAPTPY